MKSSTILSSELPETPDSIKECVNYGHWMLFKSESLRRQGTHAIYFLKVDSDIFGLGERGDIIWQHAVAGLKVQIDELFYFSDLPQPPSLSNASIK